MVISDAFKQERHRATLRALDDVDRGRLFDDAAFQAWADSLSNEALLLSPVKQYLGQGDDKV